MPRVESSVVVDAPVEVCFAVSQAQGEARYRWDPFVRHQEHLDGATAPAVGVRTLTRSRHGLRMVSEYVSVKAPTQVGMRMVEGPWFFRQFSGGWTFRPLDDGRTEATWRYTFATRPGWLSPVPDRLGTRLLGRDMRRRIAAFATGCTDPDVLAALDR